jgi:cytochrome c oxidase subunit 4
MKPVILPISLYLKVWGALVGLLALTVVAYFLPFLGPLGVVVNLAIAVAKALLVVLIFMHVRYGEKLVWLAAGGGFYWLGILLVLALSDFATRNWMPLPGK